MTNIATLTKLTVKSMLIRFRTMNNELDELRQQVCELQREINEAEELHYDKCAALRAEIALLKQQLRMKEVN